MLSLKLGVSSLAALNKGVQGVATALSQLKRAATLGQPANVAVFGDSTGDTAQEWIYGFAAYIANSYPSLTVTSRIINATTSVFPSATNISTGGAGPIEFWNGSVAGKNPTYLLGVRRATSMDAMPATVDIVIINYGLNSTAYVNGYTRRGQLMTLVEAVKLKWPTAPVVIVNENPRRDDTLMDPIIAAWTEVESLYPDVTVLDVHSAFVAAGKPAGYYDDNLHPSVPYTTAGKGQAFIRDLVASAWAAASSSLLVTPTSAFLSQTAANLLTNGDFAAFDGAVPDGWTAAASVTATKDTDIVDPLYGTYSVRLDGSVAFQALTQQLSAPGLAACKAAGGSTLAARVYVPLTAGTAAGTIGTTQFGFSSDFLETDVVQRGGWMWIVAPNLPAGSGISALTAYLYRASSASAVNVAHFSRAVLVAGPTPRNMA